VCIYIYMYTYRVCNIRGLDISFSFALFSNRTNNYRIRRPTLFENGTGPSRSLTALFIRTLSTRQCRPPTRRVRTTGIFDSRGRRRLGKQYIPSDLSELSTVVRGERIAKYLRLDGIACCRSNGKRSCKSRYRYSKPYGRAL